MVFLHGNPGSADDWVRLVGAVGATGGGRSPSTCRTSARPRRRRLRALDWRLRGFVGEALAALGIERVHLVLHDFGGPIGLVWAAPTPTRWPASP